MFVQVFLVCKTYQSARYPWLAKGLLFNHPCNKSFWKSSGVHTCPAYNYSFTDSTNQIIISSSCIEVGLLEQEKHYTLQDREYSRVQFAVMEAVV